MIFFHLVYDTLVYDSFVYPTLSFFDVAVRNTDSLFICRPPTRLDPYDHIFAGGRPKDTCLCVWTRQASTSKKMTGASPSVPVFLA